MRRVCWCILMVLVAAMAWGQGDTRRLGAMGWRIDNRVVVPVRPVVEALGGTLAYAPASQTITIALAGQTHAYTIGTDAEYPHAFHPAFWRSNGQVYFPLSTLGLQYRLPVTWNARAQEAGIATARRTVYIGVRPMPQLYARPAGTHPLLRVAPGGEEASYIIGGIAGHRYRDDIEMAPYVRSGLRYTLYTPTGRAGTRIGGRPYASTAGAAGAFIRLTRPVPQPALALSAPWNALPRTPRRESPTLPAYQQLARAVLASRGLPNVAPRVTDAISVDLDGDGRRERLVSATVARNAYTEHPQRGDYSFVAVQEGHRVRVLSGVFFPFAPTTRPLPNIFSIGGILDIDGDRRMEVLVHYRGYEWIGDEVYRLTPTRIINLFGAYVGGI